MQSRKSGRVKDNYRRKSETHGVARSQRRSLKVDRGCHMALCRSPCFSLTIHSDLNRSDAIPTAGTEFSYSLRFGFSRVISWESSVSQLTPSIFHDLVWCGPNPKCRLINSFLCYWLCFFFDFLWVRSSVRHQIMGQELVRSIQAKCLVIFDKQDRLDRAI